MFKISCIAVAVITHLACNTSTDSITVSNLHILYEQNAKLYRPLQKKAWSDITCPTDIANYDQSQDENNCVCMQKQGWEKIDRLSDIKLHEPGFNNVNHVWIKGEFYIKDNPEKYYAASLHIINGRDIIYINNRLMGIKNVSTFTNGHMPSIYLLPSGVLVKGKNHVHMRLEISSRRKGSVSPGLLIQTKPDYLVTNFLHEICYKIITALLFIMVIALCIYSAIRIFTEQFKKLHVLSFLILLIIIIIVTTSIVPLKNQNTIFILRLLLLYHYAFMIIMLLFFHALYETKIPGLKNIIIFLIAVTALVLIFIKYDFLQIKTYLAIITAMTTLCFSLILYMLYKLNKAKPDLFRFISLSMVTFLINIKMIYLIMLPLNISLYVPLYTGPIIHSPCAFALFILGTFETRKRRKQSEAFYEKIIKQQAKKPAGLTITSSSEEKLTYIIEFINENYTEDLSREGIAATVNINPNYLSSLFNAYTGKKFQEYINLLRIQKAAELIKGTDEKISVIASRVGFVNKSTFIRSFKKEMGKTPQEYRVSSNNIQQ